MSHPRQIDSLVRRPDDARKIKRQARAERKAAAEAAREEEARKTKGKKRREMDTQLAALRKEVGEKEWAKVEEVLEGEFDEDTWERVVGGLLSGDLGGEGDDDVSMSVILTQGMELMSRMKSRRGMTMMRMCSMEEMNRMKMRGTKKRWRMSWRTMDRSTW